MTPQIRMLGERLEVLDEGGIITGKHILQLAHWDFRYEPDTRSYVATPADMHSVLDKVLAYFSRAQIPCGLAPEVVASRAKLAEVQGELRAALQRGAALKDGDIRTRPGDFVEFLRTKVARKLKEHQIKSALHLLAVGNGANFSVPGSGKTTVVLTVFHWLRQAGGDRRLVRSRTPGVLRAVAG